LTNEPSVKGKSEIENEYTKDWFLKKIRNGIAHQNMTAKNENEKWIGVRIWNEHYGLVDFEIEFTIEELKEFAIFIAGEFENGQNNTPPQPTNPHEKSWCRKVRRFFFCFSK
jgi:hypothetical protein